MARSEVPSRYTRIIREHLLRAFRRLGHGTMREVERELDLYAGYFSNPRRESLDVGVVLGALEVIGVNPLRFFAEALALDPLAVLDEYAGGKEPMTLTLAETKMAARRAGIEFREGDG